MAKKTIKLIGDNLERFKLVSELRSEKLPSGKYRTMKQCWAIAFKKIPKK